MTPTSMEIVVRYHYDEADKGVIPSMKKGGNLNTDLSY